MSALMRAAILYGQEDVRIESVPVPKLEPGELLVRVGAALTCGTDVKVYRRGYHAKMLTPPALFGHELAGVIVATGAGATAFQVGERIVSANSAPCDVCFFCRRNQPNLCEDIIFNNGAYAEYIRIPERIARRNTFAMPENICFKDAALTEPLACALRALDESGVQGADTVAIMGLGPLGLMLVRLARYIFGARVIAVARRLEQIDQAVVLGAHTGVLMGEDREVITTAVYNETDGRGADVVIEAIGQPNAWELATHLVRKGGVINFFGGCPEGTKVELDTTLIHYSEITCKATFHHTPDHIRRALGYIADGTVTAQHMITGEESLDELPRVLHELAHRRTAQIKTAIIP